MFLIIIKFNIDIKNINNKIYYSYPILYLKYKKLCTNN